MSTPIKPHFVPPPYEDSPQSGRLILRDGTTAQIRPARPEDLPDLRSFFEGLSAESRQRRFSAISMPQSNLLAALCDNSRPRSDFTLVVLRTVAGGAHIVAVGSYMAKAEKTAEVSIAVADTFQGRGLGTLLLERLALLAVQQGFTRFWAVTHADNRAMLDVFEESGYEFQEKSDRGDIDVDLSVLPSAASVAQLEMRDRVATTASLRPFFRPRAVAVIGASRKPASIGHRIVEALASGGFQGPLYPVNPKAKEIRGLPAYASMREVPQGVDLAVIAVPREFVLSVVDDCAARGVRGAVVITAGFAEAGAEGLELQRRLVDKARGYGMRLIGPNCLGLLNTDPAVLLNASFSPIFPPPGRVAMSSQSGALGLAILDAARRIHLGLSTFVSVGNKADVSSNDLLQYWEEDEGTDVILLYLESFGNPRRFARIARRVGRRKPIVVLKSGRTKVGGRAAGSHTAALATSDVTVDALFRQTGVIRADTLEEMFDLASALANQPLPRGPRVGIVTNAGGPGILCADACEPGALVLPELSQATKARLAQFLPAAASLTNPVDMIASATPEHYRHAIETLLTSGDVDSLIVIYIPVGLAETRAITQAMTDALTRRRAAGASDRPVLACIMEGPGQPFQADVPRESVRHESLTYPRETTIPAYAFPEAAAHALSKVSAYAAWRRQPVGLIPDFADMNFTSVRAVCRQALAQRGSGWLSAEEAAAVLAAARLPALPGGLARTPEEAVEIAGRVGWPVAVKLASRKLVHKTEVGGVHLHLSDASAVRTAFAEIRANLEKAGQGDAFDGVVVQPMLTGGVEVMIGMTQDPLFGPVLAFGLGGIFVEILGDVCLRVTPLTDRDAAAMVHSIRGFRLLQGYRGHPPADLAALEEILLRISRLVEEVPEIRELDLNPIFARLPGEGASIVDARFLVHSVPEVQS